MNLIIISKEDYTQLMGLNGNNQAVEQFRAQLPQTYQMQEVLKSFSNSINGNVNNTPH